jgi:predicted nucleic acid-binding protein
LIVLDASVLLEILLQTPDSPALEEHVFAPGISLHAPHLVDIEVAQVLRRYAMADELEPSRARIALEDLRDFPLNRYPHTLFLPRIFELRHNVTAYDAAYIALAEALPAPLLTRDARLAAAKHHRARIELV